MGREHDCGNATVSTQILHESATTLMKAVNVRMKKNLPLTNEPWLPTGEDERYKRTSCHHRRSTEINSSTTGTNDDR